MLEALLEPSNGRVPVLQRSKTPFAPVFALKVVLQSKSLELLRRGTTPGPTILILCSFAFKGLGSGLANRTLRFGRPPGDDCSFYGRWRHQLEVRFDHVFHTMPRVDCSNKNHFSNSKSIPMRRRSERTAGPTLPDVAQPPDRLCWKSHAATPVMLILTLRCGLS